MIEGGVGCRRSSAKDARALRIENCPYTFCLTSGLHSKGHDEPGVGIMSPNSLFLYIACTRARDRLLVTGVKPGSEFLAEMRANLSS
jgi:hypothetical protein